MSTQLQRSAPTKTKYADRTGSQMTFKWIRPMPENGYLGEVTFGTFFKKPIQVFDAQPAAKGVTDWGFQAQDGSFLLRMLVTHDENRVTFTNNKKGAFPNVTVYVFPFPDGYDRDRDHLPIEP